MSSTSKEHGRHPGREQSIADGKAARLRGATFAQQTERDRAALAEAVASGRAQAQPDV